MEEGFIPDKSYMELVIPKWLEGPPQISFWSLRGIKVARKRSHPVRTYRCDQCGYLESYAS